MRRIPIVLAVLALGAVPLSTGASAEIPTCGGQEATIVGTDGPDSVSGVDSPGKDVIVTLGGDDGVWAGGGNDVICTGDGDDRVRGMQGADLIVAGPGNDTVTGGDGYDVVKLGPGDDWFRELFGLGATVYGGAGDDDLTGADTEPSRLYGETGSDTLWIHAVWDREYANGGAGADLIDATGFNQMDGMDDYEGVGDRVVGGWQPAGASDECWYDRDDVLTGCETTRHFPEEA